MRILGIETSCDETAAAVVEAKNGRFSVLSNVVASQVKIHAKTGGVVPEVAAREHIRKIIPVLERALNAPPLRGGSRLLVAGSKIDAIAVTTGPGLATSLMVGVEVARTLAYLWKKPVVAVNHLAGHIYANWLNANGCKSQCEWLQIKFPVLALIVSGGHTELVLMRGHLKFKIIGSTRDDAAGECFDKVAKMLNLGYPGGPAVAAMAEKFKISNQLINKLTNQPPIFPRPMIDSPDFDFSFSGLKTAVLYYLKSINQPINKLTRSAICYEFQQAVVDVLVAKTIRAAKKYKVKTILLGGGVAANKQLREWLSRSIKNELPITNYHLPPMEYTTDNAAMIAAAGYFMARKKQFIPLEASRQRRLPRQWRGPLTGFTPWQKLDVNPNWEIGKKI